MLRGPSYRASGPSKGLEVDDPCEVGTISFWESMDAVRRSAGQDPEQAKLYPR